MKWRNITIQSGDLEILFNEHGGAFPDSVTVTEFGGKKRTVFPAGKQYLEIAFADGLVLRPAFQADAEVLQYVENSAQCVEFINLPGVDQHGNLHDFIHISLKHEFFDDGTAFTRAFFISDISQERTICRCELVYEPDFSGFDELRYHCFNRFGTCDATVIQKLLQSRFLPAGLEQSFDDVFGSAGFHARRQNGPSLYCEFFMEGGNTVSGKPGENNSGIRWIDDRHPVLYWNFASKNTDNFYWRNQWGWIIRPATRFRHTPPLPMYHWMDNEDRYPHEEELDAICRSGVGVLILHECWRSDAQDGGIPFNIAAFRKLIENAHVRDIRVCVYMRGNEKSVHEDYCSWFHRYLQYNYDGLYMDYGGPYSECVPPKESYPGGQILFRDHYLKYRRLRETVGPEGLLYSHTGPFYSALGMAMADGYTSGEGERGILIRGRAEHEYYSMCGYGSGSMWTAAFPEYSSPRMTPFLAFSGQAPHAPLGFASFSSSLSHPRVPGINDHAFRDLWTLWNNFRNERDITVFNDFNSGSIFPEEPQIGHYLMLSRDRSRALLIVTNFDKNNIQVASSALQWNNTGFIPGEMATLEFEAHHRLVTTCGKTQTALKPNQVAGFIFAAQEQKLELPAVQDLIDPMDYPSGKSYLEMVAEQRSFREDPPRWQEAYLTIRNNRSEFPASYENSLLDDLFDMRHEVIEFLPDGSIRSWGFLEQHGLHKEPSDDFIDRKHCESHRLSLRPLLGPGEHHLAIRNWHQGELFYSWIVAELSDGKGESRIFRFCNELEPDRAFLHFSVILAD
ncbi:MAG: hypothetical protein IKA71_03455 [Lentisphaeria bacterium]|nr:hypothetical protein [Lentisphaeria bacterium]